MQITVKNTKDEKVIVKKIEGIKSRGEMQSLYSDEEIRLYDKGLCMYHNQTTTEGVSIYEKQYNGCVCSFVIKVGSIYNSSEFLNCVLLCKQAKDNMKKCKQEVSDYQEVVYVI